MTAEERADRKLERLDREAPAQLAAKSIQRERMDASQTRAAETSALLVPPVLALAAQIRGDGLEGIRAALLSVLEPMRQLVAADHIQRKLIGDEFIVPNGAAHPASSVAMFKRFLKAVPENMRPDGFTEEAVFADAHTRAVEIISQITETKK